ncbi:magnesium transporter MRS2-3-like [Salvia splendens]|uniref:magnesium transporter MRS2-3-like n=1 Tax=Salvia splendens TaxID=180675 RepID=UPI001C26B5EB|nr:magnesium transporter MRS2-3-like [Salvia splendens]
MQSSIKSVDVEELEMILEAYFVQIEGTLNKLSSALREYVDDTEDYINIMLDDKQKHLLQMGVVLTTATLTGVFGMNMGIQLFHPNLYGMSDWLWTVGGSTIASVFCYVIAVACCRYQRLLE